MSTFVKRNVMSFADYVAVHGSTNLIENPKKPGSFFLASVDGAISAVGENALAFMKDTNNSREDCLNKLQFHEFSPDGATWIPCVTLPSSTNVVRTF